MTRLPCLSQASNGAGGNAVNASPVTLEALADGLTVAAQDVAFTFAA